jgi:hypothetical protein
MHTRACSSASREERSAETGAPDVLHLRSDMASGPRRSFILFRFE